MSDSLFLKYKNHIEFSIANAANLQSKITNELLQIEGMTGKMTKHFYNNLLELAVAKNYISEIELKTLQEWRESPSTWKV